MGNMSYILVIITTRSRATSVKKILALRAHIIYFYRGGDTFVLLRYIRKLLFHFSTFYCVSISSFNIPILYLIINEFVLYLPWEVSYILAKKAIICPIFQTFVLSYKCKNHCCDPWCNDYWMFPGNYQEKWHFCFLLNNLWESCGLIEICYSSLQGGFFDIWHDTRLPEV